MAPRARLVRRAVSREIRDGLLQDIVAMGLMTNALRAQLRDHDDGEQLPLLDALSNTLASGAERLRLVINELEYDVACVGLELAAMTAVTTAIVAATTGGRPARG